MIVSLLLAVSLSIDALGVGISYGLRGITTPFLTKCILLLESMGFMFLFSWVGHGLTRILSPKTANFIGILLLFAMGLWLCYQSLQKKETDASMVRNPSYCDKDHSSHIDAKEGLALGFILSIDSMGAGIGAGAAGISMTWLPFFTALFQILFLSLGMFLGKQLKTTFPVKENLWTACSGIILIGIACLRFFL